MMSLCDESFVAPRDIESLKKKPSNPPRQEVLDRTKTKEISVEKKYREDEVCVCVCSDVLFTHTSMLMQR